MNPNTNLANDIDMDMDMDMDIESSISSSVTSDYEMDDTDLLRTMSRQDLFNLIKTDPEYYLKLIKDNKLQHELSIFVTRSNDGGSLNIKFRIYPEDRWTEVGYFDDAADEEVYRDLVDHINILLGRSQKGSSSRAHLVSQLDKNNDITSIDYGKDINKEKLTTTTTTKLLATTAHKTATAHKTQTSSLVLDHKPIMALSYEDINVDAVSQGDNLKDDLNTSPFDVENLKDKPIDTINNFVALILNKIISQLHLKNNLCSTSAIDYANLIHDLKIIVVPKQYKEQHEKLLDTVIGCAYLQKMQKITEWTKFPELNNALIAFHKAAIKLNPEFYSNISKDELLNFLDDIDKEILTKYSLDIKRIWTDYNLDV
jgi:hypothetical protein